MQISLETFETQNFKCLNCNWQGKGKELDTENISEEHWIIDFECPKCSEHIGSGQADSVSAVDSEKEKWKYHDKIFELAGEGGSISFYRVYDKEINSSWYYYQVSEMGFEEEGIPPTNRKSEYSYTFWESLILLKNEKPHFYKLYPLHLEEKLFDDIIELLRLFKSDQDATINYHSWSEVLSMTKFELLIHLERKS